MTSEKKQITKKILVADDDMPHRLLIREALEIAKMEVVEAVDGKDAFEKFKAENFDLVILDIRMPNMNGFEVCEAIRKAEHNSDIPIVMITGLDDVKSVMQAYDVGATDFLTKPVVWPMLSYKVRYLLKAADAFTGIKEGQQRLNKAQAIAHIGNWDWDLKRDSFYCSPEAYRILRTDESSMSDPIKNFLDRLETSSYEQIKDAYDDAIQDKNPFQMECRFKDKKLLGVVALLQCDMVFNSSGEVIRLHGIIQDITSRKEAEERISKLAYFDPLTGLPNRQSFKDSMSQMLLSARRNNSKVALLFLDLDRFKDINDTMGHDAGDKLLQKITQHLKLSLRPTDLVAKAHVTQAPPARHALSRLGGDEFTILLPNVDGQEASMIAQRVLSYLSEPIVLKNKELNVTSSIGIAMFPQDGDSTDVLLKNADIAMYSAKKAGGNTHQFYDSSMQSELEKALQLEKSLKVALQKDEFILHYQPKVDAKTGSLHGLEALVRWQSPSLGLVFPDQFIQLAEERSLIVALGEQVLDKACRQLKQWQNRGVTDLTISVNISSQQLQNEYFEQQIKDIIKRHGVDAKYLELELTESGIMENIDLMMPQLAKLKAMGLRLSIDDFGTGYSSMAYLQQLPLDILKIDKSFIMELNTNSGDATITKAIIGLAQDLGLTVVAEGVESKEHLDMLKDYGCDQIQGYYISRPQPSDVIWDFIEKELGEIKTISA